MTVRWHNLLLLLVSLAALVGGLSGRSHIHLGWEAVTQPGPMLARPAPPMIGLLAAVAILFGSIGIIIFLFSRGKGP